MARCYSATYAATVMAFSLIARMISIKTIDKIRFMLNDHLELKQIIRIARRRSQMWTPSCYF